MIFALKQENTAAMDFKPYNKKGFLLPDSIHSMAAYHAKLFPEGKYVFRIHDCLGGVRLTGDLKDESDYDDAAGKLLALAKACNEFALHILTLKDEVLPDKKELIEGLKQVRKELLYQLVR